jgi:anti-sigma B factor antagonist
MQSPQPAMPEQPDCRTLQYRRTASRQRGNRGRRSGTVDALTAPQLQAAIAAAARSAPRGDHRFQRCQVSDILRDRHFGCRATVLRRHLAAGLVADGPATSRPLNLIGITNSVVLFASLDEALNAVPAAIRSDARDSTVGQAESPAPVPSSIALVVTARVMSQDIGDSSASGHR